MHSRRGSPPDNDPLGGLFTIGLILTCVLMIAFGSKARQAAFWLTVAVSVALIVIPLAEPGWYRSVGSFDERVEAFFSVILIGIPSAGLGFVIGLVLMVRRR